MSKVKLIKASPYVDKLGEVISTKGKTLEFSGSTNVAEWWVLDWDGGKQPLFIQKGSSLEIKLPAKGEKDLSFAGKGSAENVWLQKFYKKFPESFGGIDLKLESNIDAHEIKAFKAFNAQDKYIKSDEGFKGLNSFFKDNLSLHISGQYYSSIYSYPLLRHKGAKNKKVERIPSAMIADAPNPAKALGNPVDVPGMRNMVDALIAYKTYESNRFESFADPISFFNERLLVSRKLLRGELYIYKLAREIFENCGMISQEDFERNSTILLRIDRSKKYFNVVNGKCNTLKRKSEKQLAEAPKQQADAQNVEEADVFMGARRPDSKQNQKSAKTKKEKPQKEKNDPKSSEVKPSKAKYKLVDFEGNDVDLTDYKGKVVYVDFWAGWCRPCIGQLPHAKKLKESFSKKEQKKIVFLYISIDRSEAAWKGAVNKYKIDGEHVFSPGGWRSTAAKHFQVGSIPRYMLIDKKGNIVDSKAKRPSDPKIADDIRKLLK